MTTTDRAMLLDPGMDLTLRPMRYPQFYDRFRDAIKNTWSVEEVDLHSDLGDLARLSPERRVSAYQVGVTGTVSFDDDF